MALPQLHPGSIVTLPWLYPGYTVVTPWLYCDSTLAIPWHYRDSTLALPWLYPGYTMTLPWLTDIANLKNNSGTYNVTACSGIQIRVDARSQQQIKLLDCRIPSPHNPQLSFNTNVFIDGHLYTEILWMLGSTAPFTRPPFSTPLSFCNLPEWAEG